MILFDTETTGKLRPELVALDQQPEIIEFAAIKVEEGDFDLPVLSRLNFLIRPRILPLSDETVKITGITTQMVMDQPTFAGRLTEITHFFLSERSLVAHNLSFDVDMVSIELRRLQREHRFPWPYEHHDTVQLTMDIEAKRQKSARLKLSEAHEALCGHSPSVKHRAMDDVETLLAVVRALRALDGRI